MDLREYLKNNWLAILICVVCCPVIVQAFTSFPSKCYGPINNPYTGKPDMVFKNASCVSSSSFQSYSGFTYKRGTWTVTPTNLTVIGTPTYTGTYTRIGERVIGEIAVQSTTSTASTLSSTTFNLPYAPASWGVSTAYDAGTGALLGNGVIDLTSLRAPTWAATNAVVISFSYRTLTAP